MSAPGFTRRGFLGATGGGIVLLFLADALPPLALAAPEKSLPTDWNAFLRIAPDGRVTCYVGKIERGQGVHTSLKMMLADELDVALETTDIVMGDTAVCPWDRGTWGSLSTRSFGPSLRAAGAEARQVLVELAAAKLGVPADKLTVENGVVFDPAHPAKKVSYGELARGERIERRATGKVAVKTPAQMKIMGTPRRREDAVVKVTGAAQYAGDIRVPGMLYARVLRPPAHGAELKQLDTAKVATVPSARVVRDGDFVAVVHANPELADAALEQLKPTWKTPPPTVDRETIFEHLMKAAPEGSVVAEGGDLGAGAKAAHAVVEETYLNDYVAHAPMEPHTALARFEGPKVTVWASTQNPFGLQEEVARLLHADEDSVHIITPFVGGGFGGKSRNLQALEAVRCAKLAGAPVQVAWRRKEEFFNDSFRPAAVVKIRSGVGADGKLALWDYQVYAAGERGAAQFYAIPNHRTRSHSGDPATLHPFAVGPWRAPGNNTNTFARESQIDLMAERAGADPVEFRRRNLTDAKLRKVLDLAAEKFGWKPRQRPARTGTGWGVALATDAGTQVALCAEVTVDKASGHVQVTRVVCAQDMGLVVNPAGATIQTEGGITMGLGYALRESVRFKGGDVLDENFDSYQLPRFSWVPRIDSYFVDDRESPPQGGGEPAIVPVGAAIANAFHDATGVRITRLPMAPARVKEALARR